MNCLWTNCIGYSITSTSSLSISETQSNQRSSYSWGSRTTSWLVYQPNLNWRSDYMRHLGTITSDRSSMATVQQ